MSISDFDNDAPDNRPTERWTRIADAARQDERRKIWRLCGLGDNPPASDAEFIAGVRGAACITQLAINAEVRCVEVKDAQSHGATSACVAETIRSRVDGLVKDGRERLASVYSCFKGAIAPAEWTADDLVATCVREIETLANVDPELHEDVTAHVVGDVVLRSRDLARAVASLRGLPEPTHVRYLRLAHDAGEDWYSESTAPRFGLSEKFEAELSTEACRALSDGDGAAYLDVLRRVADECQIPDISQMASAVGRRPDHVWTWAPCAAQVEMSQRDVRQDVVRFLQPVLANLRGALGLPAPDVVPVSEHDLHNALQDLAMDIESVRQSALWLAAWDAQGQGPREYLLGRLAERDGRGFDLVSLLGAWASYWRARVSPEVAVEIEAFANKLRGGQ